jgi:oligosaccharide repeat unit polymerase
MIAFSPIIKFEMKGEVAIQKPSLFIVNAISILFIICSFLSIPSWIGQLQDGLKMILLDSSGGLDIYHETMANSQFSTSNDGRITNLPAIVSGLLVDLSVVFFFYYLSFEDKNRLTKLLLWGIIISIIILVLKDIAYSQRGPAIDRVFCLLATYFFFKRYLSEKINRIMKVAGVVFIAIFVLFIGAITISRFTNEGGALNSVYAYSGMQNVNFSKYAFDNNGIRYGDRTFPIFKKMLGFENVPNNFWEGRAKYPHLKIDDGVFIGFVGDFVLDFGPIIAFIIFVIFNVFVINHTKIYNRTIRFHQLLLLIFVINICINGGIKLYPYAYNDNLRIIVYIISYITFRVDYENNYKYKGYNTIDVAQ